MELGHEQIYYTNFKERKLLSLGALEEYRDDMDTNGTRAPKEH